MKEVWSEIWQGLKIMPEFPYLLTFLAFGLATILVVALFSCTG